MDPQPMLSVVIPMYNAERTIQATLWSLLRQPCLEQIEILCVDDGSADSTIEKCRYLMRFSDRVRLITLPHHGVSFARNRGIEAAGAPYVAFLDSDDCWTEGFFDEQILSLLRQAEDLYGFGWATVSSDQGRTRVFPAPDRQISGGLSAVEACTQSFCAFFYRRQFLRNCRICFPERSSLRNCSFTACSAASRTDSSVNRPSQTVSSAALCITLPHKLPHGVPFSV